MTKNPHEKNILNEANIIIKKLVQEQPNPFANVERVGLSTAYAFFTAVAPSGTVYELYPERREERSRTLVPEAGSHCR